MHYLVTGGAGHIGAPLVNLLLAAGHRVTAVGRHPEKLAPLAEAGAETAIGSLEDGVFVEQILRGVDGAYLMIPPNFAATDWLGYQRNVADNFVAALRSAKTPRVVFLSSVGAHMGKGAGPVDGLAYAEQKLSTVADTKTTFLRPSYFMYNLLGMIPLVRQAGIMGSNFGGTERPLVLTHTHDIAQAAYEQLIKTDDATSGPVYVASDERTTADIARVLGTAIGNPELAWVPFTDEQALTGMLQAGLPPQFAEGYVEMGKALRSGEMESDYWKNKPAQLGIVKLEEFAITFQGAYSQPA